MSGAQTQTASQTMRKTFSSSQMRLAELLNEAILKDPAFKQCQILIEKELPREEFRESDGRQKFFSPDIALKDNLTGLRYDLEVMGECSKSDDPHRHEWMVAHGLIPLYLSNKSIIASPEMVMRRIRDTMRMMRIVLGY